MKKTILIFSAILCSVASFGEYAADKNFVYSFNVGTLEAAIVNFLSCVDEITIPSHVAYRGDTYTITEIAYESFQGGLFDLPDSEFGYYDYDKARSSIKRINIPETVTTIKSNAFIGMRRLEMLIIPEKVTELHDWWFGIKEECVRLKTITFLGCPNYYIGLFSYREKVEVTDSDYIEKIKKFIDAPEQTRLLFPARDAYFEHKHKNAQLYQNEVKLFNRFLISEAIPYNQKLKTNPFAIGTGRDIDTIEVFMESGYYIFIIPDFQDSKEQAHDYVFSYQKNYQQKIVSEYERLLSKSIEDCRIYNPSIFIKEYGIANPDFAKHVDELLPEYRCKLQRDELFLILYDKSRLPETTCRQDLYKKHTDLYASQEEFNSWYDKGDSILSCDILQRETLQKIQEYMLTEGAKITLQDKTNSSVMMINRYLQQIEDTPYYEEGLKSILNNGRFAKEYSKQQSYFTSLHDFYISYCLSDNYKKELKKRKSEM